MADSLLFAFLQNLAGPASTRDIAAEAVLIRFGKERIIFLQDAAVLWDKWQNLVMYQDPVFKHPLWPRFWQEVLQMCERVNEATTQTDAHNLPAEVRNIARFWLHRILFRFCTHVQAEQMVRRSSWIKDHSFASGRVENAQISASRPCLRILLS
jgi:hypothetical protein